MCIPIKIKLNIPTLYKPKYYFYFQIIHIHSDLSFLKILFLIFLLLKLFFNGKIS